MKPTTKVAMQNLIKEAREKIPFKLLEYLDMDLCNWEQRLKRGDAPSIDNLYVLANDCKRIYAVLLKQGLVKELCETCKNRKVDQKDE